MLIIGRIVRDKRWKNAIWCLCKNYEDYAQFAKDLFLFTGLDSPWGDYKEETRWMNDVFKWSELFGVDLISGYDAEKAEYWVRTVNPINDVYEIKEKPYDEEYPVIVHYSELYKNVLWISLDRLRKV